MNELMWIESNDSMKISIKSIENVNKILSYVWEETVLKTKTSELKISQLENISEFAKDIGKEREKNANNI